MSRKLSYQDILAFPKIDLHRHLDGAVKPELVINLAKRLSVFLPSYDLDEFKKIYQIVEEMSIDDLLARFAWAIAVMRTPAGLEEVAYQQVLNLAEENILYAEIRLAPGYHSIYPAQFYNIFHYEQKPYPVMTLEEVVENALRGIKRGCQETGIFVNLILSIPRECYRFHGFESAYAIAQLAVQYQDEGVVALDLACDEYTYPPEIYANVFQATINSKIRRDPHAGEMGGDNQRLKNIKTCIDKLSADGLGHAIPLYQSAELIELVKAKKIRIERNPLANVGIKQFGEDGLDLLLRKGVLITINSDDPVLMQKSLTDNFAAILDFYDWGEKEMQQFITNSINSAFFVNSKQEKQVKKLFKF